MSTEKLNIPQVVIVEGKYDKIKLSSIINATIIPLDGFGIFNNSEKQSLFRQLAVTRGLIVLTDSDPAGNFIRARLRGMLPKQGVIHLYTPQIEGKERRKLTHSKAGLLGVEGIDADKLRELLAPFASGTDSINAQIKPVTKTTFFEMGLSGGAESAKKRQKLAQYFNLPHDMSANALIEAINLLGKEIPPEEIWNK